MIGSLSSEADATGLADHLLSLGIDNHIERSAADGSSWLVWVERDDDLERATGEFEQFQRNPADDRYAAASREAARIRADREAKQKRRARNFRDMRGNWLRPHAGPGPVTLAIIAFCCIVATSSWFGVHHEKLNPLLIQPIEWDAQGQPFARPNLEAVKQGEVWRLMTPILIHYGTLHLLFNMMWMYQIGSQVEDRKGGLMLVVLVLVSAVPSNVLQFYHSGPLFGGMSGVVYALFGYVWMKGRYQPQDGMGVDRGTVIMMLVWLVLCMTVLRNIANTAHVVGLGVGLLFGVIPYAWERARRGR